MYVGMNWIGLGIQLQLGIDKADRHMRTAVHDVAQGSACLFAQTTADWTGQRREIEAVFFLGGVFAFTCNKASHEPESRRAIGRVGMFMWMRIEGPLGPKARR